MKRHVIAVLGMLVCTTSAQTPTSSPPSSHSQAKAVAIYAPRPDYPIEARQRHLTGAGVAVLEVDPKTGYVTSAQMEKSMGHPMLDHAALAAFSRWRFKPGTVRKLRIHIRYTIGGKT